MKHTSDGGRVGILISLAIVVLHWRQELWVSASAPISLAVAYDLTNTPSLGQPLVVRLQ